MIITIQISKVEIEMIKDPLRKIRYTKVESN